MCIRDSGCSWEYSDAETDYSRVDAIEVSTGPAGLKQDPQPGPNPFTPLAIDFYEHALSLGAHVAAVASSDSHNAGRTNDPVTQSPIGQGSTFVFANDLSAGSIQAAVEAGHTFAKVFGANGPDLRFEAKPTGAAPVGIMGDTAYGADATFTARVLGGPDGLTLLVVKNGVPMASVPVSGKDFKYEFKATSPGSGSDRYRLQVQRSSAIEAVSTPIWLAPRSAAPAPGQAPPGAQGGYEALGVRGIARHNTRVRRGRFRMRCRAAGTELRLCRVSVRLRKARGRSIGSGTVRMTPGTAIATVRLNRTGTRLLRRERRLRVTLLTTAVDTVGRTRTHRRRVILRYAR